MRRFATLASCAALGLAVAACSSERSGEFTTEDGDQGEYTVSDDGDEANISITTDEGTATMRTGSNVPVDLPLGFTVYPGAEVVSNTVISHGEGEGTMIVFTTDDSPEQVTEFYRGQAEAAEIEVKISLSVNDGAMIGGEGEGGRTFSVNTSIGDDGTTGQLMVGDRLGE